MTNSNAARTWKLASWNVNGLRAVLKKDPSFTDIVHQLDADVIALQETKLQEGQVEIDMPGYHQVWSYAQRKGYSGTAVFTRVDPLSVRHADSLLPFAGEGEAAELLAVAVTEGRVCALEFDRFWLVDVYTPNAQNELARIDTRMAWDDAYRTFLKSLEDETGKPVITCGDFNVAHNEIDLKNPKSNRGNAGFSDEERGKFTELLDAGFTTRGAASIPMWRASTAGGATASTPGKTTPDGELITFWYPMTCENGCARLAFMETSSALTTAL